MPSGHRKSAGNHRRSPAWRYVYMGFREASRTARPDTRRPDAQIYRGLCTVSYRTRLARICTIPSLAYQSSVSGWPVRCYLGPSPPTHCHTRSIWIPDDHVLSDIGSGYSLYIPAGQIEWMEIIQEQGN